MTWEQFFDWLMGWEGRVVHNDPRDPGGQTAWGISRRYWPKWAGWEWVDQQYEKDIGSTSWWITKKLGYVGVRIGAMFGVGVGY